MNDILCFQNAINEISYANFLPGGQSGKDVPAIEHATVLCVSTVSVHFSIVPSVQVLFCS